MTLFIGTAGWSIARAQAHAFGAHGMSLERYATRFAAVEINSSFHRPHRPSTWARWGSLVPAQFRFAVKVPKSITHERRLVDCHEPLARFLEEVDPLGSKLAIFLVQLPPKLAFDPAIAADFFGLFASLSRTQLVCEPRHPTWFEATADALLGDACIARVAADPAPVPTGLQPGGWRGLDYWRLHGSPQIYRSAYGYDRLHAYADVLGQEQRTGRDLWCMFDNTASSAAIDDALRLDALLRA